MPFINVKILSPHLDPAHVTALQKGVTSLMADVLHKKSHLTAVLVEHVAGGWSIGGESTEVAAHLDAKITAGTNTPEEKARFIAEAQRLLKETLDGSLPVPTYVVIHEVAANAWGYDGLTQDHRAATP